MPKILIIQTAFIGDVVLATGLIEKLHEFYPKAQIDFLVRKGNESLLQGHPYLNRVLIWNKKEYKLLNLWSLLFDIRDNKYDMIINLQRFMATGILTAFSGAKETIGFDKNPLSGFFTKKIKHVIAEGRHEVERNHALIAQLTDSAAKRPKLYPSNEDRSSVKTYQHGAYITIAPASVWFTKQFPADQWIKFIDEVPVSINIFLLGASSDTSLCDQIKSSSNRSIDILAGKLSFLQSAALMEGAIMNYVNDSAPMHFCSAMNAPVTAIYCSTVPDFGFGPLSDSSFIVQKEEPLYCRPCGLHGYRACPEKHFRCAREIQTSQLIATLEACLPPSV